MAKRKSTSRFFLTTATLVTGALLISGCETITETTENLNPFVEGISYSCPESLVLADAATITKYRDGSPKDVLDLEFTGLIEFAEYECEWDIDPETRSGTLSIEMVPRVSAQKGAALTGDVFKAPYFVSLTDGNRQVITKSQFDLLARVPSDTQRFRLKDRKVEITTPVAQGQTDQNFIVYLGFQLTADELDYNRAARARQSR